MNKFPEFSFYKFHALKAMGLRLMQAVLTVLGASVLIWSLLPLTPGDPALRLLESQGVIAPLPQEIEAVRHEWEMDRPLPVQYFKWLNRALHGDLSISAALIAALYEEQWPDHLIRVLTQIGAAMPSFLMSLLVLYLVVLKLHRGHIISNGQLSHVWLPALCLGIGRSASWTQLLRVNLLEMLTKRYTLVATARGASKLRVLLRYALPNAAIPFFTAVGVGIGTLLGGAPIIEVIFSWPGTGSFVVESIAARDMPVIQGFVMISTIIYIVMSLLVDILAGLMDARVRVKGGV